MEKELIKAEITAPKVRGIPFQKGEDPRRNEDGRPKGSLSFTTIWNKAIKKIAEANDLKDVDEVDIRLLQVAVKEAMSGNYSYFRDIYDRRLGRPTQTIDLQSDVTIKGATEVAKKLDDILDDNKTEASDQNNS